MMRARWTLLIAALVCTQLQATSYADLPDPTRPSTLRPAPHGAVTAKSSAPRRVDLILQSTLISPERRIAIINGRTVSVGAKIDGAEIIVIRPNEVMIKQDGTTRSLRLLTDGVAQRPSSAMENSHE